MPKRIFWKQMIVGTEELASRMTALNFQPRKFKIIYIGQSEVLVLYVDKEIANVE